MKAVRALIITLGGLALVSAVPGSGQKPALGMLDQISRGDWELRMRGGDASTERMCIDGGRRLIQLRHQNMRCDQVILDDKPAEVTVQYTCARQGYGRTHIRRETSGLIQIDTQGISNGFPFSFAAEARRVGDCRG